MTTLWEDRVCEIADQLTAFTFARPPSLGSTRLVCVDGRAGAGKTTLGDALAGSGVSCGSVALLHMDDMYAGWSGLGDVSPRIQSGIVDPLTDDRPGRYQRYDWHLGSFAEWHTVEPVDLLVLEGVGSGALTYTRSITTLVWVEAPRELCLARGMERDGEQVLPYWLSWMDQEDELFVREGTRARAHVIVDGSGVETAPQFVN